MVGKTLKGRWDCDRIESPDGGQGTKSLGDVSESARAGIGSEVSPASDAAFFIRDEEGAALGADSEDIGL